MMDWISVKDELPKIYGKFKVKTTQEKEMPAYFHRDGNRWRSYYKYKATYWGDCITHDPIDNVTHWMSLPQPSRNDE